MHREGVSPGLFVLAGATMAATDGYAIALWDKQHAISVLAISTVLAAVAALYASGGGSTRVIRMLQAAAFATFGLIQWHRTVALYGSGSLYTVAHYLALVLPLLGLAILFLPVLHARSAWYAFLAAFAAAGLAVIRCSPKPTIDVWYFLQHATRCVTQMCNPYTMTTPQSPGVTHGITYFPGAFLLLAPFRLIFGDVRYGLLAALIIAACLLRAAFEGRAGLVAGALALTTPGTLFGLEESWVEPLLLVLVLCALLGWRRGSRTATVFGLGAAFLTKQHMLLLAPLALLVFGWRRVLWAGGLAAAVALPWIAVSPSAFYQDTIKYFLDLPGRLDALSVWLIAPKQINDFLPIVVVAAMYAIVVRLRPSTPEGFLIAAGLILAGFELTNKISFYNEWALPAMFLMAGGAAAAEAIHHLDANVIDVVVGSAVIQQA